MTEFAAAAAHRQNLSFAAQWQDEFPATENDTAAAEKVMAVCGGELLDEYMRWSEDFGWYLKRCRGAFFGIGCGEDWPGLHTKDYEYPDALLEITAECFHQLAVGEMLR